VYAQKRVCMRSERGEDFDLATAKVLNKHDDKATSLSKLWK
jgi:hypothetical protein